MLKGAKASGALRAIVVEHALTEYQRELRDRVSGKVLRDALEHAEPEPVYERVKEDLKTPYRSVNGGQIEVVNYLQLILKSPMIPL